MSPWAVKRMDDFGRRPSRIRVARIYPSKLRQIAVANRTGDDNNQDISALVGKSTSENSSISRQNDPDASRISGRALPRPMQGLLEFVEMFKAPIKVLHPLLTGAQEGNISARDAGPYPLQLA